MTGITIEKFVGKWLDQMQREQKIAAEVSIADVTIDHPSNPTEIAIHLSNGMKICMAFNGKLIKPTI